MMLIDMFAGGGGLSEGFFRSGYEFVSHIEMNKHASETLETRALYHSLKNNKKDYYAYLKEEISRYELFNEYKDLSKSITSSIINEEISDITEGPLIKKIKKRMYEEGIDKIDGIIGGPPCQAYSLAGRSRSPTCMEEDPRNYLYLHYIKFLNEFNPDFFVFENVPGMISAQNGKFYTDFKENIKKKGYNLEYELLNAVDFGVLQSRERLIFIGHKIDNDFFKVPFESNNNGFKVYNLLSDLPTLNPGEGMDSPQKYRTKKIYKYHRKSRIRTKKDILIQHKARMHNETDREIYRRAIKLWDKKKRRIKYGDLPEKLQNHKNKKSFNDRFKVVAGDLKASHTIVAHISKDGHYYIHPDLKQARSLTVREAARIQSFPDNFKFEGPRTAQYAQIGNAVPPLMAEGIVKRIKKFVGC